MATEVDKSGILLVRLYAHKMEKRKDAVKN